MTNLFSHFFNNLLTIPQVFGGLTLTTFTSSDPRGAFAPKIPWDNIAKIWNIDKHTLNIKTVLKNPKTEIRYWTMCKYLTIKHNLQNISVSDNIW